MTHIVGHRGARNLWAENSLGGFRRVRDLGVDAVELDVHLSADGEIVVIHDPLLERTTDGRGPVAGSSLAALRQVRLRETLAESIPTLAEVLDVFAGAAIDLEIELKTDALGNPYPGLIEKVAALVDARDIGAGIVLTCFVPDVLAEARQLAPRLRRLASVDRRSCEAFGGLERTLERFVALDCLVAVEQSLLAVALERCIAIVGSERLGVWVPNTPHDLAFWLAQPIARITSDRPDLALLLRAERDRG